MRKEIIVAIVIGLILGLVIAYGVRSARVSLDNRQIASQKKSPSPSISPEQANSSHSLFITSPEPNTVTDEDKVTIVGTTSPGSLLSIISDTDQVATNADVDGTFTAVLELSGGINSIDIKSYNTNGDLAAASFAIIYSTADFGATPSATKTQD